MQTHNRLGNEQAKTAASAGLELLGVELHALSEQQPLVLPGNAGARVLCSDES